MNDSDLHQDKWLGVLKSMGQYGANDKRAPYKPLLILWLIARLSNGGDPGVRFRDAESELTKLLAEFRVGRTEPQPKYPFVYLGSSPELWQVTDEEGQDIFKMSDPLDESSSTPAREMVTFLRKEATGRVSDPFIEAIKDTGPENRSSDTYSMLSSPKQRMKTCWVGSDCTWGNLQPANETPNSARQSCGRMSGHVRSATLRFSCWATQSALRPRT